MAIPVSYLVEDAALKIGDPNKSRVKLTEWTAFYNQSVRELCSKANVLQFRALFNLGDQATYHYPDEMTVMTGMEINETPDNDDTWRPLREVYQDEFRAMTGFNYPIGGLPDHYFADLLGFYLIPRPTALLEGGGRITYFGIPDRITDAATADFQLPQIAQDYVIRRMVVHGLKARNRHAEATSELQEWYADVEGFQDRLEDRSHDRPSSLAPRRNRYAGMR